MLQEKPKYFRFNKNNKNYASTYFYAKKNKKNKRGKIS